MELLEHLKNKFMPIEIWVKTYKQKKSEKEILSVDQKNEESQFFDFHLKIELSEINEKNIFDVVPVKYEPWNNPTIVFRLKETSMRRIKIYFLDPSDPQLFVEK